jgi:ABC-type amino acid transport system permease subunit
MSKIKESLSDLLTIQGAMGACIVDYTTGMTLGMAGSGVDLELAAAGNTEVVKAKMKAMKALGLKESIEDILITLDSQLHIIRPTSKHQGLFIYLVLNKDNSNLALARRKVIDVEANLEI